MVLWNAETREKCAVGNDFEGINTSTLHCASWDIYIAPLYETQSIQASLKSSEHDPIKS